MIIKNSCEPCPYCKSQDIEFIIEPIMNTFPWDRYKIHLHCNNCNKDSKIVITEPIYKFDYKDNTFVKKINMDVTKESYLNDKKIVQYIDKLTW